MFNEKTYAYMKTADDRARFYYKCSLDDTKNLLLNLRFLVK